MYSASLDNLREAMVRATRLLHEAGVLSHSGHGNVSVRLSDAEVGAIARLKTVKRSYSQAYWINGTRGRGTVALRVGPTEYGLATSDPVGDVPRRTLALEAANGDAWEALERLAEEGWEVQG